MLTNTLAICVNKQKSVMHSVLNNRRLPRVIINLVDGLITNQTEKEGVRKESAVLGSTQIIRDEM